MSTALVWFRRDLRLTDNPMLRLALRQAERVIPVYLHCPEEEGGWAPGAASRGWLHHSLHALDGALQALGSRLIIRRGEDSQALLQALINETGADQVCWNRLHEPATVARDQRIKAALRGQGLRVESGNASLLHEPARLHRDGRGYRVFTPFWKVLLASGIDQAVVAAPESLPPVQGLASTPIEALDLLPRIPWDRGLYSRWTPGEAGAQAALAAFMTAALQGYAGGRDRPDQPHTSRLSPHLHFGEIGPRRVIRALLEATGLPVAADSRGDGDRFAAELGWREFAHHLLFHYPHTPEQPMDSRFAAFPWHGDYADDLRAWQRGQTGIPLVDAGMRELWATGWMHNRVRMVVASFLTKNLLIPWQEGARWFWDTLVDADLASNTLGWQWTAGCGADAAPYFRVFNPVLQGEKFDPVGAYVRRWLPELARLPDKWLHRPWEAPVAVLAEAGLVPGRDYPLPIVDLKASRARALAAFAKLKQAPSAAVGSGPGAG
jgi:deoxyribodipyrimidine photo-lyase